MLRRPHSPIGRVFYPFQRRSSQNRSLRQKIWSAVITLAFFVFGVSIIIFSLNQANRNGLRWRPLASDSDQIWQFNSIDKQVLSNLDREPLNQTSASSHPALPTRQAYPNLDRAFDEVIMKHQFPRDCHGKKFLVWRMGQMGAGSDLHTLSWALAVALTSNRILMYDPDQVWRWADADFCGDRITPDCFFLPITNCTTIVGENSVIDYDDVIFPSPIPSEPVVVSLGLKPSSYYPTTYFPPVLMNYYYRGDDHPLTWFRTVSTRFFWRPNRRFQAFIDSVFEAIFGGADYFPERAIAMHVRHGDKAAEMTLHPVSDYLQAAETIKSLHGYMKSSRTIILLTDDPLAIEEAKQYRDQHSNSTQWRFVHLNDAASGLSHYGRWYLVTAHLAARADAWVLTTKSNWCRVINEMRKIQGKSGFPSIDLEPGEW